MTFKSPKMTLELQEKWHYFILLSIFYCQIDHGTTFTDTSETWS